MQETTIALKVLVEAAKAHPDQAHKFWDAIRILLKTPLPSQELEYKKNRLSLAETDPGPGEDDIPSFRPLMAEFDYADENGNHTHRTIWVMEFKDGRDIKRNQSLGAADRYGYLLVGYCTLRKKVRAFRSSRISNFRTFTEGSSTQPNHLWYNQPRLLAG